MAQEDWPHDRTGLSLFPLSLLGETPAWVSGCWQADFGVMGCPVDEHAIPSAAGWTLCSVLMGTTGTRITFPAEAGSENWRVPLTPSFLPVLHRAKLKPCVFSPCGPPHTAGLAGWLVGKCCGLLNNMWSQETFSPSLLPLLFESPFCVTPLGSLGESGKRFLSVSGLQRHSPPSRLGLSFKVRHTMDVIGEVQ